MAHVAPIYPNFARGEVSPLMFGRIDIEQYPSCLDKCRNVYIRPYGCASRVSGTEFVSNTKNSGKVRLLKFVFSATDSYIIECGAGYFRFYQDGAPVYKNGAVYEISNDYYEDQLDSIQYVQLDDVIKLVCLPHNNDNSTAKPKELIRNASDNWIFQDVTFKETPYLDQNTTDITMTPSATTGSSITITASENYFNSAMVGANMWIGTKVTDTDTNKDVQGYVKITAYTDAKHVTAEVKSKLSGTSATKLWGEGAFSNYRGYPAVIALYDGRLYYARTPYQPRNIYGSKPYAYETFTPAVDNEDDAGINVELATNANGDGSDIKWMIGASYLLCGTYGGEFVIRGTGDGAITATDISARQRTNWGGEPIQPIVAGTFVHFLQRNGNKLRQFQYDFYYDSYKAVDVSIFSEHLLSSPIKEMALQKNPDSIIYLMREDGKVVMLTLEQDQSVQAWSLLEELGAKVESIQTIPSYDGNYDEVYMVMNRKTLSTTLTYTCSNPYLTITDNYEGTKKIEGEETAVLTYNSTNGVWTAPESTTLETKLSIVSSNPSVTATTTYSQVKETTGSISKTLECVNNPYVVDDSVLRKEYAPTFNTSTGIASDFENGYFQYNPGSYDYNNPLAYEELILKIRTSDDVISEQTLLYCYAPPLHGVFDSKSDILKIDGEYLVYYNAYTSEEYWRWHISANTDYWLKTARAYSYIIYISTDGVNYSSTNGICRRIISIGVAAYGGQPAFKGTIDLANSSNKLVGREISTPLASKIPVWKLQGTESIVDITSPEYEITISGTPNTGDTLTCTWNTISGYADLDNYGISVSGSPSNGDTITLTYTTTFSAPVRYIERMLNPITPEQQNEWWYVRSGLKYDGFEKTKGKNLTLSANSGIVTATADSSIFTPSMIENRIRFIDEDYNILGEGTITAYTSATVVTLDITTAFQSQIISGGKWGISTDVVSGLGHLNGQEVCVYADCVEQESKTVADGSITIDDAFIAVVGLPYQSYITTMPMEAGSQNGTAVGKRKRISEMAIRVWDTIGVKVGRDLNNLYDTIYNQKEPFTGVIPNIKYNQGWKWDANITVEQSHPYPMNILSIAPIVTEVDK